MDDSQGPAQEGRSEEPGHFRAVLVPYRSLSPRGFTILMSLVGAVSFITGVAFLKMGAWPVFGFFGLDVALVYIAFKLNYRSARLTEIVELTPDDLTITRIHVSGRTEAFSFNPYWVRLRLVELYEGRSDLRLGLHGREITIGKFLSDDERRDFAAAFSQALFTARSGGRV
jgi:uncharacterized membrane protein